jgi:hypothetical protein
MYHNAQALSPYSNNTLPPRMSPATTAPSGPFADIKNGLWIMFRAVWINQKSIKKLDDNCDLNLCICDMSMLHWTEWVPVTLSRSRRGSFCPTSRISAFALFGAA